MVHKRGCQAQHNFTALRLANRRYTNFSSQQPSITINVRGFYLKEGTTPCFSKAKKGKDPQSDSITLSETCGISQINSFPVSPKPCLPFAVPTPANSTRGILHFKKVSLCLIPQPIYSSCGGGVWGRIYTSRRRALQGTGRRHATKDI